MRLSFQKLVFVLISVLYSSGARCADQTLDESIQIQEQKFSGILNKLLPGGEFDPDVAWKDDVIWKRLKENTTPPWRLRFWANYRLMGHLQNLLGDGIALGPLTKYKTISFASPREDWQKIADHRVRQLKQLPKQILFRLLQYERRHSHDKEEEHESNLPMPRLAQSIMKVLGEDCDNQLATKSSDPK